MSVLIPLTWRRGNFIDRQGKPVKRPVRGILVKATRQRTILNDPQLELTLTFVAPRKATTWRQT